MKNQAVAHVQQALKAIEIVTPRHCCRGMGVRSRFSINQDRRAAAPK